MKRVLCRPYEEITDIDDALAKYKSHASNVMDEKDDLSCSYFAKSNQTNRLGHSIRQHCMKPECSMADKEKVYKTMEELIQLGFDRASYILLDIAIQESLPNAVCGKFKGKSFQEMMNYGWFKNLIDTDYSGDIPLPLTHLTTSRNHIILINNGVPVPHSITTLAHTIALCLMKFHTIVFSSKKIYA